MSYPEDFVWGAATSAYQIEGAHERHGKGPSVWDAFCHDTDKVHDRHHGDIACDHVGRYRDDVALMKELGIGAYRFSIAWPRVFPGGVGAVCEPGLGFYDRLVDELLAAGIEPYVTLFHWDYPLELHYQGGWLNPASPHWFEEYARTVADRLSDRVSRWITINEPQVFIALGYGEGEHAPGLVLPIADQIRISHHVMLAHGLAARAIREKAKTKPEITWAPVGIPVMPMGDDPELIDEARRQTFAIERDDVWNNSWYNDPVYLGTYPEDGLSRFGTALPQGWEKDLEHIKQPLDLFGINIYRGRYVRREGDAVRTPAFAPGAPRSAYDWEITPESLYWGPRFFFERYGKPIIITENGLANVDAPNLDGRVQDPQRIDYTERHLIELRRAIADGVGVRAYFHWSFMDNFEWAAGYEKRFGMVHVDFQTLKRTPKDSFYWYAKMIQDNGPARDVDADPGIDLRVQSRGSRTSP